MVPGEFLADLHRAHELSLYDVHALTKIRDLGVTGIFEGPL
jgi:cell envelope opacity-associated protein A